MRQSNSNHSIKDPVCGTVVSKDIAPAMYRYNGKILYFCSVSCYDKFSKKPRHFLGKRRHRRLPPRMSMPIGRMKGFHP